MARDVLGDEERTSVSLEMTPESMLKIMIEFILTSAVSVANLFSRKFLISASAIRDVPLP